MADGSPHEPLPGASDGASPALPGAPSPETPAPRTRRWPAVAGGLMALIVLIVGVVLATTGGSSGDGAPQQAQATTAPESRAPATTGPQGTTARAPQFKNGELDIVRRDPGDRMAIGRVDAPVVLMLWSDMRCPFCAMFNRDTLPAILNEYVKTGKVRLEVHDVAYFGPESEAAAVAARAAAKQGKFFAYLKVVYAAAPPSGHPDMPQSKLVAFAQRAGVPDIARFTADLDDPGLHVAVQQSNAYAQALGVSSVPFFIARDSGMKGAQPIDVFRTYLDGQLAKAKAGGGKGGGTSPAPGGDPA